MLAWCDKLSSSQNNYFVKGGRIPLLCLNELSKKLQATIIFGNFVNNPLSNSYWVIAFRKPFSLVKIWNSFMWAFLSWTFDLLFINSSRYFSFEFLLLTLSKKEILCVNKWWNKWWDKNELYILICLRP